MEATTRRVPSSTNLLKSRPSGILEVHTMTPLEQEEELREAMKLPLASISRQRLRAMQINFRRCSSVDDCISSKELMNVFNEHNLGIPNRTFKMLTTRFNEGVGVNHERLWKFLVEAQSKTGRDSVQAMHKTHNHSLGQRFNEELSSADRAVLEKVHKALVASKEYDLNELRTSCEDKDPSRNGQIPKKKFKRIVEEQHLPLSGALLNNLLKRCDEENNGMVNWFEFMVLLEKAENLSISHTKSATEDGTAQSNHGCKANSTAKKSTNAPVTTNAASKSNVKPGTGKAKGTKVDGVVVRKSVVEKQKVVLKAKGKQINNNITKKSSTEEKEKSLSADQGVKGRSSALSTELGKELNRKVTFRTGESSPSSSCNSSRRGSLSSVAGDSDVFKGNGQASPRIGSTKSRQQSRPGSTVPRPASTVPAQPRPGSSTSAQPRPGSSTNPQPRPVSANQGQDLSPRPGSRSASNSSRRGSITSQASLIDLLEMAGQSQSKIKLPSLSSSLPQLPRSLGEDDIVKDMNYSTLSLKILSEVEIIQRANTLPGLTQPLDQLLKSTPELPPLEMNALMPISEMGSTTEINKSDLIGNNKINESLDDEQIIEEDEIVTHGDKTSTENEHVKERSNSIEECLVQTKSLVSKNSVAVDKNSASEKVKPVLRNIPSIKTISKKPGTLANKQPPSTNRPGKGKPTKEDKGGKKVSLKKPPPLVKRSIKQKDPKLPHSMSMQNMTSISEVSGVTDMHHSKSSPNLLPHAETEEDIEVAESSLNQSMSSQNSIVAAQGQQDNAESSLNQSMSSQNPTAAETQGKKVVAMDARSGTSSIGSINLSLDSSSVSSQEQQGMSRIESCHSLISTSSCSSTDSQAPDKTPLLQGASGIMGSKNWGKPVSLMNSFKGLFSARHKSSDKLTGSRVTLKLPQEPVKMEVVVREQPMSLYIPDNFIDKNFKCEAPKENLVLDWIYGYRGNDCRNNLHCNASGEILYFISCVAVIYNDKQHKQRYYREHTTDIRSMAVHPDQVTIATGQSDLDGTKKGVKICIRIWNCTTLKTAHVIEDDGFQQAIICLSFSQNLLAAVDNYETHTMSLWDCKTFKKVAETKCNTDVVCQIGFHPKITTRIVSVGKDHLVFWDLKGTSIQETMQADYGEHAKPKFTICMLFRSNGDLVTGDSNGMICVWLSGQNTISQVIRTTECPVFALIPYKNSLVSGGRDGSLCVWEVKETISNKTSELFIPTSAGGVRTILIVDQFIYVGTTLNCILGSKLSETESILSGVAIEKELITQGHYDEIHGLKVFPAQTALAPVGSQTSQGVFLTCGYDGMVCCYDTNTHHALWKHWIKECNMQCMDIHPSGKILVTGAKSSDLCFFSMTVEGSLFELNRMKISKSMITTVKFSPDGQVLAAGCHDGRITTVKLLDDGRSAEVIGKCNIHQSSITGLDWSKVKCYHGNYILQSSSSTLEYFNFTSSCELINNLAESRNADWITNNCMTGFYTNGIWGGDTDVTEFNYVTRSHDQNLIAAGDEDGNVTLFTYPCCKQEAKFKNFRGHTFGVNSVEFGETDKYLISIGNRDCAIIQWTLKK
ncbi:echinoderm microtubule-associated protein-like 4 isoform X3 [Anneissia japonica]|uniref:echinoderm microtubule-associated protein-like 4 isoform X3 n=1 Tax=Anneissia japonica TaxID=1529436 RepID=UPI0014256550|nr:echinoderm microtubule-associated protein-like 4 isoform X3 [Anneissia japonica]